MSIVNCYHQAYHLKIVVVARVNQIWLEHIVRSIRERFIFNGIRTSKKETRAIPGNQLKPFEMFWFVLGEEIRPKVVAWDDEETERKV